MGNSTLMIALKLLMGLSFATWVCLWVMKPTQTWKKSWHKAENKAAKTFLGDYGLNVVVFCYPLICLAMFGYVYLHFVSREEAIRGCRKMASITNLSNPVIVSNAVGVISGGELLAMALFIALLVWTLYSNISNDFKKMTPLKSIHLDKNQFRIIRVGIRFGSAAEICLAVLLLPVLRGMAIFRLIGVQFEASVRYHVWLANLLIMISVIHGTIIMSIWALNHQFWTQITKWQSTGRVNVAGAITLITGLIIWITSLPPIRRKHFQFFFSAHHLYITFILFFLFHGGDRHFYLVLPGVLLLALDKILRTIQSRPTTCLVSASLLPCRAVVLTLPKDQSVKYNPTSMILLNIPSISRFQWHPFSIISSNSIDNQRMSVMIKCHGWWTSKLHERIRTVQSSGQDALRGLQVALEGPYGPPSDVFRRYSSLILVAGGSGISPFLSFLEEFSSRKEDFHRHSAKIQLIYAVKNTEDLSMLMPISNLLSNQSPLTQNLTLKVFVTQNQRPKTTATLREILHEMTQVEKIEVDQKYLVNTSQRPKGLIWKALMTGLFAMIFLASVTCLSHIFVPKKKKESESKSPSWISDLVVICSFAFASSCTIMASMIMGWRDSKDDVSVVGNVQGIDRKMEYETTTIADLEHEIHFGRRPDLQELSSELPSEAHKNEVGVFVCGPDSMQESVAKSCRKQSCKSEKKKCSFIFHSIKFSV